MERIDSIPSPGLEVNGEKFKQLPASQFLKRLLVRARSMRDENRFGLGLYRSQNTIFIRIPKNATNSICSFLYPGAPESAWPGHASADFCKTVAPDLFETALVFATVRNPKDRFISAFNYYKHSSPVPEERRLMDEELSFVETFDDFLSYLAQQPVLQQAKIMTWHHFRGQVDFISDRSGAVLVDLLFPVEDPEPGMSVVRKHVRLSGGLPRRNSSRGERPESWPQFLAEHYQADQKLWDLVSGERVLFPTGKAQDLGLRA
ncbi:MAG: sulfotransferase family 2 domain-containing protein [Pseudomonadota bacterium]